MKKILWFIIGLVVVLVAVVAVKALRQRPANNSYTNAANTSTVASSSAGTSSVAVTDSSEFPIKHIGIELGPYDATTRKAGDFVFSSQKLGEFDMPIYNFGYQVPANSAGPAKRNPQPTFIVPLGTKVHAIVDGVVVNVPKLYSNDYSVMIAKDQQSTLIFEMEHVINPTVKVGDRVQAGDVVAEVSDYDSKNNPGYGLVEIGVLKGGTPPSHVCPFQYLDPAIKDTVFSNLKSIYEGWNAYRGKPVYDTASYQLPGCVDFDPVEG